MLEFVWSDENALRAGELAVYRFAQLGAKLPPNSRLPAAITRIRRAQARPIVRLHEHRDFAHRIAEAHRTVLEFYVISTALEAIPGSWHHRLALAAGGREIPEEDKSSMARDAQFELLMVSLVHHCGFLDAEVAEPDIRVKAGNKWVGIAAKRVTSRGKLHKRLGEATKQMRRQLEGGVEFGLIAVNVDAIIDATCRERGFQRARDEFTSITKASEAFVQARRDKERVPGIQTFATLLGWQDAGPAMALGLEFLTHARWTSPSSEVRKIGDFLRRRGRHLERRLGELLTTL